MSFISPALISRIYQALGRNKGSHAILLLRQHSFDQQPKFDTELMPLLVRMADDRLAVADIERAEEHYKLGLALYESCFPDTGVEALRCLSGLCSIYHQQNRQDELAQLLEKLPQITDSIRKSHDVLKAAV